MNNNKNTTNNSEYTRKLGVAAEIADDSCLAGGLGAMQTELANLRRIDADPVIIAEVERIYHWMVVA